MANGTIKPVVRPEDMVFDEGGEDVVDHAQLSRRLSGDHLRGAEFGSALAKLLAIARISALRLSMSLCSIHQMAS